MLQEERDFWVWSSRPEEEIIFKFTFYHDLKFNAVCISNHIHMQKSLACSIPGHVAYFQSYLACRNNPSRRSVGRWAALCKAAMAERVLEGFAQAKIEAVCCPSSPIPLLSAVAVGRDLQFSRKSIQASLCCCCLTKSLDLFSYQLHTHKQTGKTCIKQTQITDTCGACGLSMSSSLTKRAEDRRLKEMAESPDPQGQSPPSWNSDLSTWPSLLKGLIHGDSSFWAHRHKENPSVLQAPDSPSSLSPSLSPPVLQWGSTDLHTFFASGLWALRPSSQSRGSQIETFISLPKHRIMSESKIFFTSTCF